MGGYGFDTGQKPHRSDAQPTKQMPRGAVQERSEWMGDLAQLLKTDPHSHGLSPDAGLPEAGSSKKRFSNVSFQPKQIKYLLRPRSERHRANDMDIRGVARRKVAGGQPFYQILPQAGANSTYQVNGPADEPVRHAPAAALDEWEKADLPSPRKSPKKKRRSRKPLSASTFLGLPQPSFHNMTDIEREIPHLVPKKTKSRHSRQISASKLNANQLSTSARFRSTVESQSWDGPALQVGDRMRVGAVANPTPADVTLGAMGAAPALHTSTANADLAPSTTGALQTRGRTRASLGLTPIVTTKQPLGPTRDRAVATPNLSVVPSSEVLSPENPSDRSDRRSPGTRATSPSSPPTPSAMVSPTSADAARGQPPGCPTPAPTGPLPPLPEQDGRAGARRSKPIVIASDTMPTPEASPAKSSPREPVVGPKSPRRKLESYPRTAADRSEALADIPVNWTPMPAMATALPIRTKSRNATPYVGPKTLGDPFQHRVSKTKAIKQRDLQKSKAKEERFVERVKESGTALPGDTTNTNERHSHRTKETMQETNDLQGALPANGHTKSMAPAQGHAAGPTSAKGYLAAGPVAEAGLSKAAIASPAQPQRTLALTRTTYRSHSTQYSPGRFGSRIASESSMYSRGPDVAYTSTATSTLTPPSLLQSPVTQEDAVPPAGECHRDRKDPETAPTPSRRQVPNGAPPADGRRRGPAEPAPPSQLSRVDSVGTAAPTARPRQSGQQWPQGETEGGVETQLRVCQRRAMLLEAALHAVINASALLGPEMQVKGEGDGGSGLNGLEQLDRVMNAVAGTSERTD